MRDLVPGGGRSGRGGVSRREFVRVGGLGALGLALTAAPRAEAARRPGPPAGGAGARAKSVILVFLGGGLSHLDSFDPKPEAPAEVRGRYGSIPTAVPGVRLGERLPRTAQVMDRLTVVRSGAHANDHHETATNWVLS